MREVVTSVLDLVGMLLLVLAGAVLIWPFSSAGALALCGLGLLAISYLIDRRQGAK